MVRKTLQLTFLTLELWLACCMVHAQFIVQPVSVVQVEGMEAVFECLYPQSTSHSWGINGDFPTDGNFPTDLIRQPPFGGTPASLTIPALPEYNNTVVQCRATVVVGGGPKFVLSDNATLKVYAQSNFTVQPVSVVQAEGLEAVFECQYPGASYDWFINETIHRVNTEDIVANVLPSGDSPASLRITARSEYNNMSVQCRIWLELGQDMFRVERSNIAVLVVYGIGITSVNNGEDTITISWVDHPFTTSITYCVDVIQTFGTTETFQLVSSECGLTDTTYSFLSPGHGPCDRFTFTVTPTDGVDNGTSSQPVPGYFTQARGEVNNTTVSADLNNSEMKVVTIEPMVPSCYSPDSSEVNSSQLSSPMISNVIDIVSFSLPTDLRTTFTLTLTDNEGVELLFENVPISTFDIQDMTANSSSLLNSISVSLVYALRSLSPGALVIVVPMGEDDSLNYTKAVFVFLSQNTSEGYLISNVTAGRNKVFAFDIENNDVILRGPITTAADTEIVTDVSKGEITPNHPTMSDTVRATKSEDDVVNVTCSDDSLTYLVLLVYTSSPDQLTVGLINNSTQSVTLTPVGSGDLTLVVFSWGQDQTFLNAVVRLVSQFEEPTTEPPTTVTSDTISSVSVSRPTDGGPSSGLPVGAVAGITAVLVVLLAIVVAISVIVIRHVKKRNSNGSTDQTLEDPQTQPNEAYELVTKKNVSYEKVNRQRQRNQRTQPPASQFVLGETANDTEGPHVYEKVV